jgi:ATP-dependent RNA circularization protein (DNA/RNA ligase family)
MERIKYPRTYHIWFSEGVQSDDRIQKDTRFFEGKNIVVTEKMDGENTTISRDYIHNRSLDASDHPSRNWVKQLWANIRFQIPEGWRVCGENVYAKQTILYEDLESYFYVICIWNEKNECISWEETKKWCEILGLFYVKELYSGVYDEQAIRSVIKTLDLSVCEGIGIRLANAFHYDTFSLSLLKWVRQNHVQVGEKWLFQEVVPNGLKKGQ